MGQDEPGQGEQEHGSHGVDPLHGNGLRSQGIEPLVDRSVQTPIALDTPGLGACIGAPTVAADHEEMPPALLAALQARGIRVRALGAHGGRILNGRVVMGVLPVMRFVVRAAVQAGSARGAVHQHPGIALVALGAIDVERFATPLAMLEIGRVQSLALAAEDALSHGTGRFLSTAFLSDLWRRT